MNHQPALPGFSTVHAIGDPLDRCYTPMPLALAIVRWLADGLGWSPPVVVEPSVGGGSFVRAFREVWPSAHVIGVDIDPRAEGLALCDEAHVGDWPNVAPSLGDVDAVIGNPPFGEAIRHWEALPSVRRALILPLAYLAVGEWVEPFGAVEPGVRPLLPRPWGERVRETAVYVGGEGRGRGLWGPLVWR